MATTHQVFNQSVPLEGHDAAALDHALLEGVTREGAAEHLDEATAGELTRDLLSAVAGRTVILITHRPVAPGSVDQVLRLNDGRLLQASPADW